MRMLLAAAVMAAFSCPAFAAECVPADDFIRAFEQIGGAVSEPVAAAPTIEDPTNMALIKRGIVIADYDTVRIGYRPGIGEFALFAKGDCAVATVLIRGGQDPSIRNTAE